MDQTFGEDDHGATWTTVILHRGTNARFPGRFTDIVPEGIRATITEMRFMGSTQERGATLTGPYLLQFPHYAGQPGENTASRNLVPHGVGLLWWAHDMRHPHIAKLHFAPSGLADGDKGIFTPKKGR